MVKSVALVGLVLACEVNRSVALLELCKSRNGRTDGPCLNDVPWPGAVATGFGRGKMWDTSKIPGEG